MQKTLSFFLFPLLLCLIGCTSQPAKKQQPVVVDILVARPSETNPAAPAFGKWDYATGIPLAFTVPGKLEQGTLALQVGDRFRKGQLLFQINNREAYRKYSQQKKQLADRSREFLPDIRQSFPSEVKKWEAFIAALEKPELLPSFPAFSSEEEATLFRYLEPDYRLLMKLEAQMPDYFFIAPFDGIVLEINSSVGATIRSGQKIATIGRSNEMLAIISIPAGTTPDSVVNLYGDFKEITVEARLQTVRKQADGKQLLHYKPVKKIRLKRDSEIRIVPEYRQTDERFVLPKTAVRNNQVSVVHNRKVELKTVQIQQLEGDSVVVNGLETGDWVLASYRLKLPAKSRMRIVR